MYAFLYARTFKLCIQLNSNKVTVHYIVTVNVNDCDEESDPGFPSLMFIAVINTINKNIFGGKGLFAFDEDVDRLKDKVVWIIPRNSVFQT